MSDEDRVRLGTVRTELAVAIALEDALTGGRPHGSPRVSLVDRSEAPTRTPGGYHVVTDVPDDVESLTVTVDGDGYLPERRTIDLDAIDRSTAETIELTPSPAYPFAAGVTLVRGFVTDGDEPVPDATVTIQGRSESTRSDRRGEFALPIRTLAAGDVGSSRTVQVGGETPTVESAHPATDVTTTADVTVPVGETTRIDLAF